MPNEIADWKKAAIIALTEKYGHRAIGNRVGVSKNTAKRYRDLAASQDTIEMNGTNLRVK